MEYIGNNFVLLSAEQLEVGDCVGKCVDSEGTPDRKRQIETSRYRPAVGDEG
jgi:hypothetical protein